MTAAEPAPPTPARMVVAAFDFDGTLTRGGSVWRFLSALAGARTVVSAGVVLFPRLARAVIFGGRANDDAKEALFRHTLAGRRADEVAEQAAAFGLSHLRRRARADVGARLEWHRRRGDRVAIVSASPEVYVGPAGTALGADAVIATRLEVGADGRLTGRYHGRNCRGAEKVARLEQWMETSGGAAPVGEGARPFVWAYGNSAGDRRLLDAADVGVDVGRLGHYGRLRRFVRLAELSSVSDP